MILRRLAIGALLLLMGRSCLAFDVSAPAAIHIVVRNEAGQPLPGVKVSLKRDLFNLLDLDQVALSKTSDAAGAVDFSCPPPARFEWGESLTVTSDGYQTAIDNIPAFVGADIHREVTLRKTMTTLVRVLGPGGKPLPDVPLNLRSHPNFSGQTRWTDQNGICQWKHEKITKGFGVSIGALSVDSPDSADLTINLTDAQMDEARIGRTLVGRLLDADGKPAVGWVVGRHCVLTGSYSVIAGLAGPPINCYSVDRLDRVGADGSFTSTGDLNLLFLSPEGVPFLYTLNPKNWQNGVRQTTITLPSIRRVLHGVLVDQKDNPLAGVKLVVSTTVTQNQTWQWSFALDSANHGTNLPQTRTDAAGNFAIPQYCGSFAQNYQFGENGPFWTPSDENGPTGRTQANCADSANPPPGSFKDITLAFVDEAGKPIDGVTQKEIVFYAGDKVIWRGSNSNIDIHGIHYFVNRSVDRVDIETAGYAWAADKRTVQIQGDADRRIEIPFSRQARFHPVTGQVIDSHGKPVSDADIIVFTDDQPANNGTGGHDYTWPRTTTDAQGKFSLKAAPDVCNIIAIRDAHPWVNDLPMFDPTPVTKDHRDLQIIVPPYGSIRILLSPETDWRQDPQMLSFTSALEEHAAKDDTNMCASFTYDAAAHTLIADGVRVGVYRFAKDAIEQLQDVSDQEIAVKDGTETTLDWRNKPLSAAGKVAMGRVKISVFAENLPLPGAEVNIYTRSTMEQGWLSRVDSDLCDNAGTVRFQGAVGTEYVAIAHQRGKWVGVGKFTAGNDGNAQIAMTPARTLEMKMPDPKGEMSLPPWAGVTLSSPRGIEGDCLMFDATVGSLYPGLAPKLMPMISDWAADKVMEDMPIGATCHIQADYDSNQTDRLKREFDVTVAAGEGAQQIAPPHGW